ncbi:hypothetical protein L3X37_04085 [Sabulilitoribacter arenilitoris]|uniref:HEPN AbiU2-like domain-containing protein n=1 Tax=Wocania arenilitoris TaxID=2044858 RepID=A0AAE3ENT2_9FLAO|nr:hypothetical protein [Wocania arenilitoris]MCF7567544.1 hypothetical protein [Wocania arenilitoris]
MNKITEDQDLTDDLSEFRLESELHLHKFGFYPEFIDLLKNGSKKEFIKHSTAFFETKEINNPLVEHIDKLKTIRNKLLAHNQDIEIDTFVPYKMTYELIDHGKQVLSFFALTYAGIHLKGGNEYITNRPSNEWGEIFEKFIEKCN